MRNRVFLFTAIFGKDRALFEKPLKLMERRFGKTIERSGVFNFNHTDYYSEEMGANLKKMFFLFKEPISPEMLMDIKLWTIKLERRFSTRDGINRRRNINLDPGYLSLSKIVLATTKDYSHRIYLGKGIYAEVTLAFKDGVFTPFPWTYPDYRSADYINFFNCARKICYNK